MIHTLAKRIATLFYYGKSEQEISINLCLEFIFTMQD